MIMAMMILNIEDGGNEEGDGTDADRNEEVH